MFYVMIPTRVNELICRPKGWNAGSAEPGPTLYTRMGRLFKSEWAAKKLAKTHLGRVLDLNSGRKVADYL